MGLGELELSAEKKESPPAAAAAVEEIYCSICLDVVKSGGKRSTAKLQCGHEFHLDCIGSAFNAKGVMQCPNCREIGKGNWLYSNGSRSLPDRFDEWPHDEDLYDFSYSEMPFGVHWCPYSRLARVLPSFEEGETSPAIAFQDVGYHTMFTGDPATSSTSHQCPYLAYMPPLQPSSSNHPISAESHNDGPTYHHHWSRTARQTDVQTPHVLPAVDLPYHNWEHSPIYSQPSSSSSGSNQDMDSSAAVRSVRLDLDDLPRAVSPIRRFALGHGSSSRSTVAPPYFANSQSYPHVHEHYQHHNPPSIHGTIFPGPRRLGVRGLPPAVPQMPPLDPTSYYLFPPTASSSHSPTETESMRGDHFYTWGRERFAPFPLLPVEREASWWRPVPQAAGSSDSGRRWGIWHRNGSERASSRARAEGSSYRPPVTRMRPYN
ncbi:uncharacterized protein M6B38_201430 [Iris pallida]|uniref:RING-type domain-containing protein n=1 Tax=Iris pallida TaxID=29817 RepID=A0AAX6EAF3_IRIPA|nr:uncharacterized protein M6B38_201430 [Iris pallida]